MTLHGPLTRVTRIEFSQATKKDRLEFSAGLCEGILPNGRRCDNPFSASNPPEFDHDKESWEGGDASFENCRALGRKCCHRPKTDKATSRRAKADSQSLEAKWLKPKPSRPIRSRGFQRREIEADHDT